MPSVEGHLSPAADARSLPLTDAAPESQAALVLAIFLMAQMLDGALTYWGIRQLGVGVEGNVLVATAMEAFGAIPALLGAKLLACVCGLILHAWKRHHWLAAVAGCCIGVGVLPWLLLFAGL